MLRGHIVLALSTLPSLWFSKCKVNNICNTTHLVLHPLLFTTSSYISLRLRSYSNMAWLVISQTQGNQYNAILSRLGLYLFNTHGFYRVPQNKGFSTHGPIRMPCAIGDFHYPFLIGWPFGYYLSCLPLPRGRSALKLRTVEGLINKCWVVIPAILNGSHLHGQAGQL